VGVEVGEPSSDPFSSARSRRGVGHSLSPLRLVVLRHHHCDSSYLLAMLHARDMAVHVDVVLSGFVLAQPMVRFHRFEPLSQAYLQRSGPVTVGGFWSCTRHNSRLPMEG
jgi:hypothetical protein